MLSKIYNSAKQGISGAARKTGDTLSSLFSKKQTIDMDAYRAERAQNQPQLSNMQPQASYNQNFEFPSVIPKEYRNDFLEQAQLAGVTPYEFGLIAKREQGANTLPHQAQMVGLADPTDLGLMQVNEMHNQLVQQRFRDELGEEYNPNNGRHSMIAARMILEENRRQLEQMKRNNTFQGEFTNTDLINTYNTGVRGWVEAQQGDKDRMKRLQRYETAGLN